MKNSARYSLEYKKCSARLVREKSEGVKFADMVMAMPL